MGGFGGSASAMNQSLKANRALLKKRITFSEIHNIYGSYGSKKKYKTQKVSEEYLDQLRGRLQKRNQKNTTLKILVFVCSTILIGALLYFFLFAYS